MNHIRQGRQDVKLLKEYSTHAQKRKVVPKGTVPCEILTQIFAPNYRKPSRTGVKQQAEPVGPRAPDEPILFTSSSKQAATHTAQGIQQAIHAQQEAARATTSNTQSTTTAPRLGNTPAPNGIHQTPSTTNKEGPGTRTHAHQQNRVHTPCMAQIAGGRNQQKQ